MAQKDMAGSSKEVPADVPELVMSRVINAPRELVYSAWTDPEHVPKWWGPNGFTITLHEMDVRPGGVWRFMMHGPDGTNYPNKIVFEEVIPPERLVYMHGGDGDDPSAPFKVTVTFEAQGGKTLLTSRLLFPSFDERQRVIGFGAVELGKQSLAKLDAYVQSVKAS